MLNLASIRSSPDRSTKSTRLRSYDAPTACRHRGSGSLSLPSRGPFHLSFTVLSSIGHWVVFSLAGWSPRLPTRFPVSRGTLDPAALPFPSPTGLSPSLAGLPRTIPLVRAVACAVLNPVAHAPRFGLPPFRSPLLWGSIFLSRKRFSFFSSGYLDVSVRRVPFHTLWIHAWIPEVSSGGFPHSDICGSLLICSSPQLFAACHVFHRLPVPRHPPCALLCLTLPFSRLAWRYLGVSRISPGFCLVCMSPCFPAFWHACTCLAFGTLLHVSVLHVPLGCLVYLVFDLIFKIFFSVFGFQGASLSLAGHFCPFGQMGLSGLEPPTSRLSGVRSNRLSYKPSCGLMETATVEIKGFEPLTPCLQGRCSPN